VATALSADEEILADESGMQEDALKSAIEEPSEAEGTQIEQGAAPQEVGEQEPTEAPAEEPVAEQPVQEEAAAVEEVAPEEEPVESQEAVAEPVTNEPELIEAEPAAEIEWMEEAVSDGLLKLLKMLQWKNPLASNLNPSKKQ